MAHSKRTLQTIIAALVVEMMLISGSSYAATHEFRPSSHRKYDGNCLPADQIPTALQADLVRLMGRTDSLSNKILASRGVARVPTTQIVVVSDTTTCRRASEAYSVAIQIPSINRTVYAIRAGIRYIVIDPSYKLGEWKAAITFDSTFTQPIAKFMY